MPLVLAVGILVACCRGAWPWQRVIWSAMTTFVGCFFLPVLWFLQAHLFINCTSCNGINNRPLWCKLVRLFYQINKVCIYVDVIVNERIICSISVQLQGNVNMVILLYKVDFSTTWKINGKIAWGMHSRNWWLYVWHLGQWTLKVEWFYWFKGDEICLYKPTIYEARK